VAEVPDFLDQGGGIHGVASVICPFICHIPAKLLSSVLKSALKT
jgi:hypothetical protein